MKKQTTVNIIFGVLVFMIIASGTFFRLWQLDSIPPGLQYDEAYNGLDAINTSETGDYKIFYPGNNGREGIYINAIALGFKFFGISNFTLRMISAFFGIATLIGFYFLLRQLKFAKFSVLMGLSALATSFWHLNFSRIVYRGIMVPFLLVWLFYFFFRGLRGKKYGWIWMAAAGFLTGIGMHTYIAFRVAPLAIVIMAAGYLVLQKKEFVKKQWINALVLLVFSLVTAVPIFLYFFSHQQDLTGRSTSVSIFNSQELTPLQAFGKSLAYHLGSFLVYGDPNQRHNNNALPLIPAAWGVFFVLGFIFSIREIIQTIKRGNKADLFDASLLAQAIFWVMLIPGVMSIEGIPHALRIIGTIPAVFIFIAIPFDYLLRLYRKIYLSRNLNLKSWRYTISKISIIGLGLVVMISGAIQIISYFYDWSRNIKTAEAFERSSYDFGKLVKETRLEKNNILVLPSYKNISSDHKDFDIKQAQFEGYPNIDNFLFYYPLDAIKDIPCENTVFLFFESDEELLKQFEKKCPQMQAEKIKPEKGLYDFWVMR